MGLGVVVAGEAASGDEVWPRPARMGQHQRAEWWQWEDRDVAELGTIPEAM